MKTRIKQLEASAKYLQGCLVDNRPEYKAIYRKNLHYVLLELNQLREKK